METCLIQESRSFFRARSRKHASYHHITIKNPKEEENVSDALSEFDHGVKAVADVLKVINFGTSDDPHPIYINFWMTLEQEKNYMYLLLDFKNVFVWNYSKMLNLDPRIAVYNLSVKRNIKLIKQVQRGFRPELIVLIENKINKID